MGSLYPYDLQVQQDYPPSYDILAKFLIVYFIIILLLVNLYYILFNLRRIGTVIRSPQRYIWTFLAFGECLMALIYLVERAHGIFEAQYIPSCAKSLVSEAYFFYYLFVYGLSLASLTAELIKRRFFQSPESHPIITCVVLAAVPWLLGLFLVVPMFWVNMDLDKCDFFDADPFVRLRIMLEVSLVAPILLAIGCSLGLIYVGPHCNPLSNLYRKSPTTRRRRGHEVSGAPLINSSTQTETCHDSITTASPALEDPPNFGVPSSSATNPNFGVPSSPSTNTTTKSPSITTETEAPSHRGQRGDRVHMSSHADPLPPLYPPSYETDQSPPFTQYPSAQTTEIQDTTPLLPTSTESYSPLEFHVERKALINTCLAYICLMLPYAVIKMVFDYNEHRPLSADSTFYYVLTEGSFWLSLFRGCLVLLWFRC